MKIFLRCCIGGYWREGRCFWRELWRYCAERWFLAQFEEVLARNGGFLAQFEKILARNGGFLARVEKILSLNGVEYWPVVSYTT